MIVLHDLANVFCLENCVQSNYYAVTNNFPLSNSSHHFLPKVYGVRVCKLYCQKLS